MRAGDGCLSFESEREVQENEGFIFGFGLLLMGSHKFRWQTMNRKEFCSSRPDHPFPCSGCIKPYLKIGGRNHESTAGPGKQMGRLDFNFKFIYDFKGRLRVERRAFFPLFLFRSVTLKYSCPKLGLKKKNYIPMETPKNSLCLIGWQKTGKLNHLPLEIFVVFSGVAFVCF